uniref:NADH-ubiquinone oxidoreductase chain 3 n=1 Tax=Gomphiocephalus hodgsoni TaxID=221270 RepID=Q85QQ8_GOMHO|nr:NADH dehydrogenase subunit 3 [Gomphiocephalus hodgsoni]AAO43664.1 NADH dehydrogenase subunit 3 [Gomphiocephalus hodgsoni]
MSLIIILIIVLPLILISINSTLFKKDLISREKMSPFECGFDPKNTARLPFSMRFYLIAVIFLIFDIEIALILPIPFIFNFMSPNTWIMLTFMFLMILLGGLFHEWNQGALNWSK